MRESRDTLTDSSTRRLFLIALLFVAAFARFFYLGRQGLWMDEGFTWMAIHLSWIDIYKLSYEDVHPPLYYFILKAVLPILPHGEAGLRLPSALLSIASLGALYHLVRTQFGSRAAVVALAAACVAPMDIYFAQEARMYSLQNLLIVTSLFFLVQCALGQRGALIPWAILNASLAWCHAYGLIMAGIEAGLLGLVGLCELRNSPRATIVARLGALAGTAALMAPMVVLFSGKGSQLAGSTIIPTPICFFELAGFLALGPLHNTFYWQFATAFTQSVKDHPILPAAFSCLAIAVLAVGLVWTFRGWKSGSREYKVAVLLCAGMLLLPPIAVYALSTLRQHAIWVPRGFSGLHLVLLALAAVGWARMPRLLLAPICALIIAVSAMFSAFYIAAYEKSDMKAFTQSLPPDTEDYAVMVYPHWKSYGFLYYVPRIERLVCVPSWSFVELVSARWKPGEVLTFPGGETASKTLKAARNIFIYGSIMETASSNPPWINDLAGKKVRFWENNAFVDPAKPR